MYEVEDIMLLLRKIFVGISFLVVSGKRRNAEILSKFVSMRIEMIKFLLKTTFNGGWIEGSTTNFTLTNSALKLMTNQENANYVRTSLERAISMDDKIIFEDQYRFLKKQSRSIIEEKIKLIKGPIKVMNILEELLNNTEILMLFRIERFRSIENPYNHYNSRRFTDDLSINPWKLMKEIVFQELKEELVKQYFFGNFVCNSEDFEEESYVAPRSNDQPLDTFSSDIKSMKIAGENLSLSILPDFEVITDISSNFQDILKLSEFSDIVSVDKVVVSKITKSSLLRYINKFGSLEGALKFLTDASKTGIPENVKRLILDVGEQQDEISIIPAQFVVKAKDRNILDNLLHLKEFQNYFGERISHNAIAVKDGFGQERIVNAIRKKGYVVKLNKP